MPFIDNISPLKQRDSICATLLEECAYYQQLSHELRKRLPENIAPHCRVACVRDDLLVIYGDNNIVVNRLKMLLPAILANWADLPCGVRKHKVLLAPQNQPPKRPNTLTLSATARISLSQTAEKLTHHPELAAALKRLSHSQKEK
ncbi:MAG: DUF721 domain-containing protein [Neisseriaceae bacterium]|nr:DUF721 domain-containing protein [Neisseriaceae bacterium]